MNNSITIFIYTKVSELHILEFLENTLRIVIASIEKDNDNAKYFLQHIDYSEGFKTMICLTGPDVKEYHLDEKKISRVISEIFRTKTLIELVNTTNEFEYLLIDENGNEKFVNTIELEDGIDIKQVL